MLAGAISRIFLKLSQLVGIDETRKSPKGFFSPHLGFHGNGIFKKPAFWGHFCICWYRKGAFVIELGGCHNWVRTLFANFYGKLDQWLFNTCSSQKCGSSIGMTQSAINMAKIPLFQNLRNFQKVQNFEAKFLRYETLAQKGGSWSVIEEEVFC